MSMTINGSGTITGLSAGGLPDGSIQQADLAANVAGNGPAFSAYYGTGSTAISNNTLTKVPFTSKDFDTNNYFDATTNYRFTPLVAGYYQINTLVYQGGATGETVNSIYKNGSPWKIINDNNITSANTYRLLGGSALVYLNGSTDYIEIYTLINGASPVINSGQLNCWVQGFLARSA